VRDQWLADLERQGCDDMYVANMRNMLTKLADGCGWTTLASIRGSQVREWLADIRQNGVPSRNGERKSKPPSDRTVNQYLETAITFLKWCCEQDPPYLEGNPLAKIKKTPKSKQKSVRPRRALSEAELSSLLAVAGDRASVYRVAALTGLRKDEMRQLQWRDVHLDHDKPHLRLRSEATKSRRADRIPLHPAAVAELQARRPANCGPLDPVFPAMPTIESFKDDLAQAGIQFRNAENKQADFHSLRYTFCTLLAKAGVPVRTAMELMRHRDPKLTLELYCDAGQLDTDEAVGQLPTL
jgi:integrase